MPQQNRDKNDIEYFLIEPNNNDYNDSILEISNKTLGVGYIDINDIRSKENVFTVVAFDVHTKKILGFILGKVVSRQDLFLEFPELKFEEELLENINLFGIVDPIGVDPSFQRKGIGKKLIGKMVEILEFKNVDRLISPAWFYYKDSGETHVNVGNALESSGFHRLCQKQNYWTNDCKNGKFICPMKSSTCGCGVIFYQKIN